MNEEMLSTYSNRTKYMVHALYPVIHLYLYEWWEVKSAPSELTCEDPALSILARLQLTKLHTVLFPNNLQLD